MAPFVPTNLHVQTETMYKLILHITSFVVALLVHKMGGGGEGVLILNFGRQEGCLFEWGAYLRKGGLFEDLRYLKGCRYTVRQVVKKKFHGWVRKIF